MKGIPEILEFLIHILDTDDKRVKICESPKDIFILGFYYSKIEKSIINSKIYRILFSFIKIGRFNNPSI